MSEFNKLKLEISYFQIYKNLTVKTKVATHTIFLNIGRNVFNYFTYLLSCLYYTVTHFYSFTFLL